MYTQSTSSLAMYPDENSLIDEIFASMTQAVANPDAPPSTQLTAAHIDALIQILERWPLSQRFPGTPFMLTAAIQSSVHKVLLVIDLCRLVIAFHAGDLASSGKRDEFFKSLFKASEWDGTWSIPLNKTKQTNILLLLRTIANAFQENSPIAEGTWAQEVL